VNKSFWSFLDSPDIQQDFTVVTEEELQYGSIKLKEYTTKVPSDGFVDAFMDLLFYINTCPPGAPITVEWNTNLPCYTCDTQVFKEYSDFPKDLPSQKHVRFPCSRNGIFHHYGRVQK